MSLSQSLTAIRHDIVRHAAAYPAARARHTALASFETPKCVLRALAASSSATHETRNAIVAALLEEHRASRSPLWQAILFTSFSRMLKSIRWRLRRPGEDLDQDVLVAFAHALRVVPACNYSAVALRWATQKESYRGAELESRELETVRYEDDTHPVDPFGADARDRERAAEIVEILESHGDELLEVVLATHAGNDSLRELVDEKHAGQPRHVRAREYKRLGIARRHVIETIRRSYVRKAA